MDICWQAASAAHRRAVGKGCELQIGRGSGPNRSKHQIPSRRAAGGGSHRCAV